MHCTTRCEGSEVEGDKSGAVDQLDHSLFGFGGVAGCKDDGTGFVRRKVLYPVHRHVADRFYNPFANRHLSNHFAGCAPFQRGPRSSNSRQTNVGFGIHMRVRRIDQNSATPIDTFQRFPHVHPMYSENNDVALGRLLPGPRDGARAEISGKTSQRRRPSGIGYNYGVTSICQMAAERACYATGAYDFMTDLLSSGWNCERACPSSDFCNHLGHGWI
jgi:hypothetical protein